MIGTFYTIVGTELPVEPLILSESLTEAIEQAIEHLGGGYVIRKNERTNFALVGNGTRRIIISEK